MKQALARIAKTVKKNLGGWGLMLPSLLLFAFFVWAPLIKNVRLSFFEVVNYQSVGDFVGFDNYVAIFQDPAFTGALWNTVQYVFWSLVIGFALPIALAVVLNEVVHLRGFFRTALYVPNFVPGIAATAIWIYFFKSEGNGVLNSLFAGEAVSWFYDPPWSAIPLIVLTMTWKGAGATMLIYLAALQTIDPTHYEAARIEGANAWQRIRLVTLPSIMENVKTLLILQVIAVFQVFYEPLMLTKQNPYSTSLLQILYETAIQDMEVSRGAAMGVVVSLMLFALTAVYLRATRAKPEAGGSRG